MIEQPESTRAPARTRLAAVAEGVRTVMAGGATDNRPAPDETGADLLGGLLGGDHVELDLRAHFGVDAHRDGVCAERLDRVADLDATLVDLGPGIAEGVGDVGDGDGAEQAATLTGAYRHIDRRGLEVALDALG